ncbi:HAD family phosphatase [uncultured Draconibacterium sp.]|uniref:HAD family hydrolase n=1 Tax=uncultured Draconibacterium sp. TaxID=1573823 RepID=UPI0025CC6E26|nr:HAD family phosphatase [uncultured Draconibacterium sp.]
MKADLSNIKNIIFDLGRVLLNLDFDASIQAFQQLGSNGELLDHKNAYADPAFYQLEIGKISPDEFRTTVRKLLNNSNASDTEIDDAWYAMILDIPENRVKKLLELGKNYKVFLFSNTNQIHIDKLLPEFKAQHGIDFPSLFDAVYYSHELNDRKPEVSSFDKVISLANVVPAETLFVDDLEKNIIGAQQAGLQTFWLQEGMEMAELF